MINSLLLTCSLLSNTYYPIKLFTDKTNLNIFKNQNLILYNKCIFYNNNCNKPIHKVYPGLTKYKNTFNDDFDNNLNSMFNKLVNLNSTTNYKIDVLNNNTLKVKLNSEIFDDITVIGTPIHENKCRIFLFCNVPNYKKTLLYYNLRFILNKISY